MIRVFGLLHSYSQVMGDNILPSEGSLHAKHAKISLSYGFVHLHVNPHHATILDATQHVLFQYYITGYDVRVKEKHNKWHHNLQYLFQTDVGQNTTVHQQ